MKLRIEILSPKNLIGKSMHMSLIKNKTQELWQSFMIRRKEFVNTVGSDLYSVQVYDQVLDVKNFDPNKEFTKWAAIEVSDFSAVPDGMEPYHLEGGLYAVFLHKGPAAEIQKTFQYIFGEWLPNSEYELDHRAHFEVLGEKYKNNHPDSEEEVWVPVRERR